MTDAALNALAEAAGISVHWQNFAGEPQTVKPDALRAVLAALGYPCANARDLQESKQLLSCLSALPPMITANAGVAIRLGKDDQLPSAKLFLESGATRDLTPCAGEVPAITEPGYHRLLLGDREIVIAVAPEHAPRANRRLWGIAAQVYGLRREGDGGIGDTQAVAELAQSAARLGADLLALSPMHALFAARPTHYGPYSPSSRLFLNPLLASPELVLGHEAVARAKAQAGLNAAYDRLERLELIDWPAAAKARLRLLQALFAQLFLAADGPETLRLEFARFEAEGGALLAAHACFEALHSEQLTLDPDAADWRTWPADLRDPESASVSAFAQAHRRDVLFHMFLQWIAERSLAAAQMRARNAGMQIGLIADMAVGMDPAGSHAWSRQADILSSLTVGAPPDLFNPNGQQWGITTFSPQALKATGFAPFIATLRACLRNAGGVRIDHAMGLQRLWLVPEGASPADGAYLRYPLPDLLRLLALEAERHRAIIVGEDLGTVPDGFRRGLNDHGVYGMRVLWFEKDHDHFTSPQHWDRDVMAMTTTHDLPTAAGWWTGADIALRAHHGLLGKQQDRAGLEAEREQDRSALWQAFQDAGVTQAAPPDRQAAFVDAALAFVARSASEIALAPLEDILGEKEQPNLPGTIDEHPNWRRRNAEPAARVLDEEAAARRIANIAAERPRP